MDTNYIILYMLTFLTCMVINGDGRSTTVPINITIVSKEHWHAAPPRNINIMKHPVPYVIIHHSYIPPACYSQGECINAMQKIQHMHMITNGWDDIGYSFLIGGDGRVYMGRGWDRTGAHSPMYNNQSIGICFIGDWRYMSPTCSMITNGHKLIAYGVQQGYIRPDYSLFGHRQVRKGTECPGDAFFDEISTWDHFVKTPPMVWRPTTTKTGS